MKYVAKNDWDKLEVGSKVSFLLFEGCVRSIEKLDFDWDEVPDKSGVVEEETSIGYSTDYRTIIGSITSAQDGILIIETGRSQELHIPLEDHPDLKWFFIVGDVVSSLVTQTDILIKSLIFSFDSIALFKKMNRHGTQQLALTETF